MRAKKSIQNWRRGNPHRDESASQPSDRSPRMQEIEKETLMG